MKLPHRENIFVTRTKITHYLLSESHPIGASKAKFFKSLGFDRNNISPFITSLKNIAKKENVFNTRESIHGTNYSVEGVLKGSQGKSRVVTVWFIQKDTNTPRFITAYPV